MAAAIAAPNTVPTTRNTVRFMVFSGPSCVTAIRVRISQAPCDEGLRVSTMKVSTEHRTVMTVVYVSVTPRAVALGCPCTATKYS